MDQNGRTNGRVSSRANSRPGRRNRAYYTRMRRRRRRRRLGALCCLVVFLLGFLSGKAVTLNIMKRGSENARVQAEAEIIGREACPEDSE